MKSVSSTKSLEGRSSAVVYQTSLKGLQEQAILHRLCAELMTSPGSRNQRVLVVPEDHSPARSSWARPDDVLEILNGALCIIDTPAVTSSSSSVLSYQKKT